MPRDINEKLSLGIELFGNTPKQRDDRSDIALNLGGTWKLSERFNVLVSAGHGLRGETGFLAYLGLQFVSRTKG